MTGDYSSDDILRMQQDAARRVREMQARSRFAVQDRQKRSAPAPEQTEKHEPCECEKKREARKSVQPQVCRQAFLPALAGEKSGILEMFRKNSDTVLLMALLFVLYTEQADELLMLAVLYIML